MAENVLDSGPPSAKRPKLSSPALSASASDGNGKYCFMIYFVTMSFFKLGIFSWVWLTWIRKKMRDYFSVFVVAR